MRDEDNNNHSRKTSVIAKVKEKAKKWRQSFSKKKHGHDNLPPWGVDEIEVDSEHHGARQRMLRQSSSRSWRNNTKKSISGATLPKSYSYNPRGNTSFPKNTIDDSFRAKSLDRSHHGRAPSPVNSRIEHIEAERNASILREKLLHLQATTESEPVEVEEHPSDNITPSIRDLVDKNSILEQKSMLPVIEKTLNETRADKSTVNDLKEKLPSLIIPTEPEQEEKCRTTPQKSDLGKEKLIKTMASPTSKLQDMAMPSFQRMGQEENYGKGISVKEYLRNKLEPGEDERALSQVISEVMSPKRAPREKGVAEKVRDVSVMLRSEASPSSSSMKKSESTSSIPVSSNAHEVEEDTQGRILQAN